MQPNGLPSAVHVHCGIITDVLYSSYCFLWHGMHNYDHYILLKFNSFEVDNGTFLFASGIIVTAPPKFIGASLSEPHTSRVNGGSVYM